MRTYRVLLGLGSNLGDREVFLNRAVAEIKKIADTAVICSSSVYETDPYGKPDQNRFLNAALEISTPLEPFALYTELKAIEHRLGRSSTEHWGPREIDIDILIYDGIVFENTELKVPHRDLGNRKFVLVPLREIAQDLVHPVNGKTVEELLSACSDHTRVVKSVHHIKV